MKVELSRQSNCQYIQGKQDSLAAKAFLRSSCQGSQAVKAFNRIYCIHLYLFSVSEGGVLFRLSTTTKYIVSSKSISTVFI